MSCVNVIGAGLAGCEAAWQLALRGIDVKLFEMKPVRFSPAHKSADFCELVCSNSLRSNELSCAPGLLKEELRRCNSLVMSCADASRVAAGGALAVDRNAFSAAVTEKIKSNPLIEIVNIEVAEVPCGENTIIATGPLTDGAFYDSIRSFLGGDYLHFYDAAAPVVTAESIDFEYTFKASRYGKGDGNDYVNCPLDEEEYADFVNQLANAEQAEVHGFEDSRVFEGCMPVEVMARRGIDTLRHGPMKPMGLADPLTGKIPYAAVQLRRDDAAGTLFNLVGFQTHLKFGEQKRVLSIIPALKNAEIVRYGVMHRNSYIDSPRLLDRYYRVKNSPNVMFAGQITGVEGYIESAASGLCCGINMAREVTGKPLIDFPQETALGALALYISNPALTKFQPMNINFGIIAPLEMRIKSKRDKNTQISARALNVLDKIIRQGCV